MIYDFNGNVIQSRKIGFIPDASGPKVNVEKPELNIADAVGYWSFSVDENPSEA